MAPRAGADWTGMHLFLRYRDPFTLYVVSLVRQDGRVEVKKKIAGGSSNGGTYYGLTGAAAAVTPGAWHRAEVSVRDEAGGVAIVVSIDGREIARVRDNGVGGPPLTGSGKVGLREDFTQFHVGDFTVSAG